MRNRFVNYGIEGGNYTVEPEPIATVKTDNTEGNVDVTVNDEQTIQNGSDNSSTVVIDTQDDSAATDMVAKKQLVFLGGTCNESTWREKLIEGLKMSYFNPVVQDWTEDDKEKENQIKDSADFNLFVFTPKHTGYFSFVEAALLAVKSPSRTILCVLSDDDGSTFEEDKKRSIDGIVAELSKENIKVFDNLDDVRSFLNGKEDPSSVQEAPVTEETSDTTEETPKDENTDSAELSTNSADVSVKVETPEGESTNE